MADAASVVLTPPSAPVNPGDTFVVHARLTNTGTTTWPAGGATPVRVGSSPHDTHTWNLTKNRWSLPSDVLPGGSISIDIDLVATNSPGPQTFSCEMVRDFVAWFPGPAVFSCQITVASVPPPPVVVPPARTDPMDLTSFEPFPYFKYPGTDSGDVRVEKTWVNDEENARPLNIVKAYIWTGVDLGGKCDVDVEVRRISDNALVARLAWDHYVDPTAAGQAVFDFAPDHVTIDVGDGLKMLYVANRFNGNFNVAHRCEVWVKG